MSSTSMVVVAEPAGSTPQGPVIDVFNFIGGRCRTCRQHPLGGHHQRLQLWWWPLPDLPAASPRVPDIDVFNFSGGRS
jgi:hypothetical protein